MNTIQSGLLFSLTGVAEASWVGFGSIREAKRGSADPDR